MKKPTIGIFKYSSCAGCQFQLIFFQQYLVETLEAVEIAYGRMETSGGRPDGPFDIALIEGAITESWQADELKQVRSRSKHLVPIGSCAVNGGIPAIKNMKPELEVQRPVYRSLEPIHSVRAAPVDQYVPVDAYLRGCPFDDRDLVEIVTAFLLGGTPQVVDYCVCVECKVRANPCLLIADHVPCMGPVTNGGCGALCPSNGRACYACWGPLPDGNAPALARRFEELGMAPDEIVRRFSEFGYPTLEFRKAAALYE
jgi:coenzyme F420-reducing hydrogenase gamma subunit